MKPGTGGVQVKLGGAWKALQGEKEELRRKVTQLEESLRAEKQRNAIQTTEKLKLQKSLEVVSKREAWHRIVSTALRRKHSEMVTMLDTTRQERVEQERRWVQRGEELESLKAKCDEAVRRAQDMQEELWKSENDRVFLRKECDVLQKQYDAKEGEVVNLEKEIERSKRECSLVEKAKGQKEKYLVALVNQNDRLREENLKYQEEASKQTAPRSNSASKDNIKSTAKENKGPNGNAQKPQWKKVFPNGKEREHLLKQAPTVRKYDALERLQKELEACQEAKAHAELNALRLKSENESLKIRYRNQRKTRSSLYK